MTALSFCVICFNITETMVRLDDNISHCGRVAIRILGNLGINLNPVITSIINYYKKQVYGNDTR